MIPPHSYPSNRYANSSKSDLTATERRMLVASPNGTPEPAAGPVAAEPAKQSTEVDAANGTTLQNQQIENQSAARTGAADHVNTETPSDHGTPSDQAQPVLAPSEPATEPRKILRVRASRAAPAESKP